MLVLYVQSKALRRASSASTINTHHSSLPIQVQSATSAGWTETTYASRSQRQVHAANKLQKLLPPTAQLSLTESWHIGPHHHHNHASLQAAIRDFQMGMQLCINSAVNEHGFTHITVTPHIDSRDTGDGWTIRAWRNGLVLDPRQKWVWILVF